MFFKRLNEDIETILERDPAARSRAEVLFCYPGLHAVMAYRISHWLWQRDFKFLARFVSHFAKVFTGVEIHPGATIGCRLFIDHATGVVIGETAEIGNDCTLYQGVTLGGTSLDHGKRHPTLEDNVIVGAGAQILGPHRVGVGARIGSNAVVLSDVPDHATMVGIPAKVVRKKGSDAFVSYGTPENLSDPLARTLAVMDHQINTLLERVNELEKGQGEAHDDTVAPLPVTDETKDDKQSRKQGGC